MLNDQDLERACYQVGELRQQQETYQETLAGVLEKYSRLIDDYQRLKSDYEEERDSREKYKQMARGQERNPFVLVLVDGDGYVFDDDLISRGTAGGQKAAQLLGDAVKDSLRSRGLDHCRVMVRIYANLAGLSKAVSKVKLCGPEKRSLASFSASFTRSNDLFDFVDAGDLKENADYKIRAMFRQFVENAQCRHIFFAACHDVGYVSELTQYINSRDRITLVRNHAFHQEFAKLGLRSEEFPHIFRTSSLDPIVSSKMTLSPMQPAVINISPSLKESATVCGFFQKGICKYGNTCRNQHIKSNTPITNSALSSKDWRNSAQNNRSTTPHPQPNAALSENELPGGRADLARPVDFESVLPRREDLPRNCIVVNESRHRLDPYIPQPAPEDRTHFYARHSKHKLCNNHHLNDHCVNGDACTYDHVNVSPGVLNCLRQLAAGTPCPKRGACRSLTCAQGHICQRGDCKHRGGKAFCKFPYAAHTVDFGIAEYVPGNSVPRENPACDTDESYSSHDSDNPMSVTGGFTNGHGLQIVPGVNDLDPEDPDAGAGALLTRPNNASPY